MVLAAGLGAYPVVTAGRLAPLIDLLAAVGVLSALVAALARGRLVSAALFSLAIEYTVAETTGRVPAGSVIGYATGLIIVSELLLWSAQLPRSAAADRAVAAGQLMTFAASALAAAVLALAALAASRLQLPDAMEAALLGAAAAVALLILPWLLLRRSGTSGPRPPGSGA